MKYVKQIGIIGGITFAGELLNYLLPAAGSGQCVWNDSAVSGSVYEIR